MARPHSAKKIIEDNIDKIKNWSASGLTMKEIAGNLGISDRTLYEYQSKMPQLSQSIKKGRHTAIETLENTMFKCANGYTQTVKKYEKVKRCTYENGKKANEWEEMVEYEEEVYFKPDITAGIFLLKNWANYMNEPRALELRKEEIELQRQKIENSEWS
jgi:IS30 family transposase